MYPSVVKMTLVKDFEYLYFKYRKSPKTTTNSLRIHTIYIHTIVRDI